MGFPTFSPETIISGNTSIRMYRNLGIGYPAGVFAQRVWVNLDKTEADVVIENASATMYLIRHLCRSAALTSALQVSLADELGTQFPMPNPDNLTILSDFALPPKWRMTLSSPQFPGKILILFEPIPAVSLVQSEIVLPPAG